MHGAILGKEGTVCIQNVAHTKYQDISGLKTKFHFKVLTVLEYVKKKKTKDEHTACYALDVPPLVF